jgi:phospholipid-binding lipoprotein MlaA
VPGTIQSLESSVAAEPPTSSHSAEAPVSSEQGDRAIETSDQDVSPEPSLPEEAPVTIADPIEPVNRAFFYFNDKLYFWVLKPVASGYKAIFPQEMRVDVRNFFSNLATPIRVVNCLLQANLKCAGNESARFLLNTTLGFVGFVDQAKKDFKIEKQEKDFGQTLGVYGMKPILYINWPILGPSTLRETIGFIGDLSFDPRTYLAIYSAIAGYVNTGGWVLDKVNETSLTIGEYEDFKKSALDPYVGLKDAYYQYRQNKIKER